MSRYVKLDLNNAQVNLEETKELLKTNEEKLYKKTIENLILKAIIILYFLIMFVKYFQLLY